MSDQQELVQRARAVLDRNRAGDYTCPSVRLYPHQWLWDSCFTAIGIARFDPTCVADELRALVRGQWANGMLPHMIFADGARDVGSRRVWRSKTRTGAPSDVATTCITQPPLVAIAVERVAAPFRRPKEGVRRRARAEGARVPPVVVPRATARRLAPHHAHPPVGVRPRLHPAVDARARGDAHAVVAAHGGEAQARVAAPLTALRHAATPRERARVRRRRPAHARPRHPPLPLRLRPRPHPAATTARCSSKTSRSTRSSPRPTGRCARSPTSGRSRSASIDTQADALELLWHEETHEYCSRHAVTHAPMSDRTVATLPAPAHVRRARRGLVARLQDPGGVLVGVPRPERAARGPPLPGPPLLGRTHVGEHELGHHPGPRDPGQHELADDLRGRTLALVERLASPSTSPRPPATATGRPSSRGPPR